MFIQKRSTMAALAGLAVLTLNACSSSDGDSGKSAEGSTDTLDQVTIQLDYEVRGNHGIFYVADELGFFEEEGIEVAEINKGSGSPDTLRLVGSGGADFGFADLPSLAAARAQDVPVKAIAAVNQVSPLAMCSLADNVELTSVEDLQDLTVGLHPAGSTYYFYEALVAANGVDRSGIEEVTVTPPYENYLMQNQVDAVVCYIDAEVPLLEEAAGGEGSLSILPGYENGYNAYGSGMFTNEEMLANDGELVQRFTNAYQKAFEYVMENPEKTAEIIVNSAPELANSQELFVSQLQADIDHTFTSSATEEKGLGAMEESMWQSTIDILTEQGVISTEPPSVDDVYDASFIEQANSVD